MTQWLYNNLKCFVFLFFLLPRERKSSLSHNNTEICNGIRTRWTKVVESLQIVLYPMRDFFILNESNNTSRKTCSMNMLVQQTHMFFITLLDIRSNFNTKSIKWELGFISSFFFLFCFSCNIPFLSLPCKVMCCLFLTIY